MKKRIYTAVILCICMLTEIMPVGAISEEIYAAEDAVYESEPEYTESEAQPEEEAEEEFFAEAAAGIGQESGDAETDAVNDAYTFVLIEEEIRAVNNNNENIAVHPGVYRIIETDAAEGYCRFEYFYNDKTIIAACEIGEVCFLTDEDADQINIIAETDSAAEMHDGEETQQPEITVVFERDVIGVGETTILKVFAEGFGEDAKISAKYSTKFIAISGIEGEKYSVNVKGKAATASTKVTITVTDGINTAQQTVSITVKKAPTSCKITAEKAEMLIGEETGSQVTLTTGSASKITYMSSDENVAVVDADGIIHAVGRGEAMITANTYKTKVFGKTTVRVYDEPKEIRFGQDVYVIGIDKSGKCSTDILDAEGEASIAKVVYSSDDPEIISIDPETGAMTAVSAGHTTIDAITDNGLKASAEVYTSDILLDRDTLQIGKGEVFDPIIEGVIEVECDAPEYVEVLTFKSSSPKKAKVDSNGVIKGVAAGTSVITVTSASGVKRKLKVVVSNYPTTFKLSDNSVMLGEMMHKQISAVFNSKAYTRHVFKSADESVATVSNDGVITAQGIGTTQIICMISTGKLAGKTAECEVTVLPAPETVCFTADEYIVCAGDSVQTDVMIDDGTLAEFTYESSAAELFIVDENGKINAAADVSGSAEVIVRTQNGKEAAARVEVKESPAGIRFDTDATSAVIAAGDTVKLPKAAAYTSDGTIVTASVTYSSSATAYVRVDAQGNVKGIKEGSATITAKTFNGKTAKIKVYVKKGKISEIILSEYAHTFYMRPEEGLSDDPITLKAEAMLGGKTCLTELTYTSSNESAATVDENGTITPVGIGSAMIIVKTNSGAEAACAVDVVRASKDVDFEGSKVIGEGMSFYLKPIFDEDCYSELQYASSDPDVLQVNEDGLLTAAGAGEAELIVHGTFGLEKRMTYTVMPGPEAVILPGSTVMMHVGEAIEIGATTYASYAHYEDLEVSVSGSAVSAEGDTITAIGNGNATIKVTACNGVSAELDVRVVSDDVQTDVFEFETGYMAEMTTADIADYITIGTEIYRNGYSIEVSGEGLYKAEESVIGAKEGPVEGTVTLYAGDTVCDSAMIVPAENIIAEYTDENDMPITSVELYTSEFGSKKNSCADIEIRFAVPEADESSVILSMPEADISLLGEADAMMELVQSLPVYKAKIKAGKETGIMELVTAISGSKYVLPVTVKDVTYRALLVSEFTNKSWEGYLPFASMNTTDMERLISGQYQVRRISDNPKRSVIKNNIETMFGDAGDSDVSLIYIVAHGNTDSDGDYYFSIQGGTSTKARQKVTSADLMDWISGIRGHVILVLDSCYSGYFIENQRRNLKDAGNISVITAQSIWPASWIKNGSNIAEIFTSILMRGMGSALNDRVFGTLPENADENEDGAVSISELAEYTKVGTVVHLGANAKQYYDKKWLYIGNTNDHGKLSMIKKQGWTQIPQYYIPENMKDISILDL